MSEDRSLSADLKGLEARLASLRPVAPQVDRDRVMFEAGAESTRQRRPQRWLRLHDAAFVAAVTLAFFVGNRIPRGEAPQANIAVQPPPIVAPSVVPDFEPATPDSAIADIDPPFVASPDSYGELRKQLAAADRSGPHVRVPATAGVSDPGDDSSLRRLQADWLRSLN